MSGDGESADEHRARLDRMTTRELAITVFGDEEDADRWLASPQKLLNDAVPNDLIDEGREDKVRRLLRQIDEGAYL